MERMEESPDEERVPGALRHDQVRKRSCPHDVLVERIRDELRDVVAANGAQVNLTDLRSALADPGQRQCQRVRRADLGIPVGPNEKQMPTLGFPHPLLEELQRSRVHPLKVVQKQCQRMFWPCQGSEKGDEDPVKAVP
ncbi:hypothetical protein [Hyalangium versicolor]|uniref:hypothetical protein n=1 Tax=Hyalangium versicolor TaxID=2861190 RepID=UPI002103B483|nr:hypothetical protein [Hyalangium versicolor]